MIILKNYSLKSYNTFGLDTKAASLLKVHTVADLKEGLKLPYASTFILGGGSNMLLTQDIAGLVIKNEIKGIEVVSKTTDTVTLSIGGGENWHQLVLWAIANNYGGIENLSLIPGTVGASPIQNIGAYGVELKDVFVKLEAINLATRRKKTFSKTACQFGYRDSVFKKTLKGQYFITKVFLQLTKKHHQLNMNYGAIKTELADKGIEHPTIKDVSDAVIAIRSSKLPDPVELGNSGSFFKNPEISRTHFEKLQQQFPNIVSYDLPNGKVKVPAGWLIEQDGWKGKKIGNTGAHAKQALVLVNYGNATGQEVKQLAYAIIASVKEKFEIELTAEVNIV
ncbi:MAG: UDP-N-acetylmuramate dehydrogenase [Saprospiraceae bacterium]